MVSKLCIAFTKNTTTQEFVLRNGEELKEIMDLFDKIVPYACKDTIVESDTRVFHERWVGERFSVVFCMTEVSTHICWLIAFKLNSQIPPGLRARHDRQHPHPALAPALPQLHRIGCVHDLQDRVQVHFQGSQCPALHGKITRLPPPPGAGHGLAPAARARLAARHAGGHGCAEDGCICYDFIC